MMQMAEEPLGPALFEVVRGVPTVEELAVLAALLTALAAHDGAEGPLAAERPGWSGPQLTPPASWQADRHRHNTPHRW